MAGTRSHWTNEYMSCPPPPADLCLLPSAPQPVINLLFLIFFHPLFSVSVPVSDLTSSSMERGGGLLALISFHPFHPFAAKKGCPGAGSQQNICVLPFPPAGPSPTEVDGSRKHL